MLKELKKLAPVESFKDLWHKIWLGLHVHSKIFFNILSQSPDGTSKHAAV